MKTLTLLTFLVGAICAHAQFEIDSFVNEDDYNFPSYFPIIRSSENPGAAERINQALHYEMLEKVYQEDDENRFDKVFPPEGEFHGASEFEYEIFANNGRYLSLAISCAYTGAYSEYHTMYFTFDAKSGQPIRLTDLFSEESLSELSEWVTSSIFGEITAFMNTIDTEDEEGYGAEQYEMYQECADWYAETKELSEEYYFMTDTSIVFIKGRCSNHMMAALDDLWDFHEEYTLEELDHMLSDDGGALLAGEPLSFEYNSVSDGKILEGKIAGKYPITMIIKNSMGDRYYGVYWYNKVKEPIELIGWTDVAGFLQLTEKVNDKKTGSFNLQVMQGGVLDGEWSNADETKTFDIRLSISK
ncbi:MAG: hypothetical protein NXI10_03185 [bacterium]|nr:hypothetical protein [bacterium]